MSRHGSTIAAIGGPPYVPISPSACRNWLLLLSLGALGGAGHYCVARAMTYASANFVAPFNYTQMIGSVIVGYLMFADVRLLQTIEVACAQRTRDNRTMYIGNFDWNAGGLRINDYLTPSSPACGSVFPNFLGLLNPVGPLR